MINILCEELNRYDLHAYPSGDTRIRFENFPDLWIEVDDGTYVVSSVLRKLNTAIDASFSQPLQVIRYILGGLWYEIN